MIKHARHLAISIAVCVLSGCAMSKTTLEDRTPQLQFPTSGTLALTVIDDRADVVNGDKPDSFEGIYRDRSGKTHALETKRDNRDTAYSARISEIIASAFRESGSKVVVVPVPKGSTLATAVTAMRAVPFERGVVIDVKDSRADVGGYRWSYLFDYEIVVIGTKGTALASKQFKGEDLDFQHAIYQSGKDLGKSYSLAAVLDLEYRNELSGFLSDRQIVEALKESGAGNSTTPDK